MNAAVMERPTKALSLAGPSPSTLLHISSDQQLTHLAAAVKRGARLLDKAAPGWYRTGKLGKLAETTTPLLDWDFEALALAQPRAVRFYNCITPSIDGGYYGFYCSPQLLLTGQPRTRNFDETLFTFASVEHATNMRSSGPEMIACWKAEIKQRRQVENAERTAARIAKHGLAYEVRRGRIRR